MNPKESEYLYRIPKSFTTRAMHSRAGQVEYDNPNLQEAFPLWMKKSPNEMGQVTPNWKKILYELEDKYINDTRKSIIAEVVEHVSGGLQELQEMCQQNKKQDQQILVILYFVITQAPDQVARLIDLVGIDKDGTEKFLLYLSYLSNYADSNLEWYLSSAPFLNVIDISQTYFWNTENTMVVLMHIYLNNINKKEYYN